MDYLAALEERFWPKVNKTVSCWLWTACKINNGYGQIGDTRNPNGWSLVHRISWELANGTVPEGLCVLHKCDVRLCVNPDHLFLGTYRENSLDAATKERMAKGEKSGKSKLTVPQVRRIKRDLAAGVTQRKLADANKVTYQCIQAIQYGITWKGV
jgi:hypothetical protein